MVISNQTTAVKTLTTRTILITGASRGIGAQMALGLLEDGHRVIATARSLDGLNSLQDAARQLEGGSERLLTCQVDVCDDSSIDAAATEAESRWGLIEVVVNNAGIAESAPLHRTSDEMWGRVIDVNLTGSFRVTRRLLKPMKKASYGRVIFISSIAGLTGCLYTSAYCASKHGVLGMMRALALEVAQTSVTANAICPGFVETDMAQSAISNIESTTSRDEDGARAVIEQMSPQNRLFQPDEILHSVRFLIGEGARGVNGQSITVDGGQVMH